MRTIYYLCNKVMKQILYAGDIPSVWENITGLHADSIDDLHDLSWAGHPDVGFFTETSARALGIDDSQFVNVRKEFTPIIRDEVFQEAQARISAIYWRLDKAREDYELGTGSKESVVQMLNYIQTLRNIHTNQDPFEVVWPDPPPET